MASNKPMNNNRLKEIRLNQHKTQKDIAKFLGVTEQAIAYYEKAQREPPLATWQKLSDYLNVPPSYLMGTSNDITGLKDWSENTGWSPEQIKKERQRLINTGRLKGDEDIQHQYGYAVESLEQNVPTTTNAVIVEVSKELSEIRHRIYENFFEPAKPVSKLGKFKILQSSGKVRQDMDENVYHQLVDIINKAQTEVNLIHSKK